MTPSLSKIEKYQVTIYLHSCTFIYYWISIRAQLANTLLILYILYIPEQVCVIRIEFWSVASFNPIHHGTFLLIYIFGLFGMITGTGLKQLERKSSKNDRTALIINPTWEGVQILWIEGGGLYQPPPPKKSMKELCQTPGCYIEVWPI